jgi:hypothetical protein
MTGHSTRSPPEGRAVIARRRSRRRRQEVGATGLFRQIVLVVLAALAYFGLGVNGFILEEPALSRLTRERPGGAPIEH